MKVLIGLDELASLNEVVSFVSQHRWDKDVEFKIVYAVGPVTLDQPLAACPEFMQDALLELEKEGKKLIKEATESIKSRLNVKVEGEVIMGYPVSVLVDTAKEWKADLLVVGSHGRHGLDRFFFGSVSYDVAAQAPCSVMVLRLAKKQANPAKTAEAATASR